MRGQYGFLTGSYPVETISMLNQKIMLALAAALFMLAPSVTAETAYDTPDTDGVELVTNVQGPDEVHYRSFPVTVSAHTNAEGGRVTIEPVADWTLNGCVVEGEPETISSTYSASVTVYLNPLEANCGFSLSVTAKDVDGNWTVRSLVSHSVKNTPVVQEVALSGSVENYVTGEITNYEGAPTTVSDEEEVIPEKSGPSALQIIGYTLFALVLLGGSGWFIYNRVNGGYDDFEDSLEVPAAPIPAPAPQPAVPAPLKAPEAPPAPSEPSVADLPSDQEE